MERALEEHDDHLGSRLGKSVDTVHRIVGICQTIELASNMFKEYIAKFGYFEDYQVSEEFTSKCKSLFFELYGSSIDDNRRFYITIDVVERAIDVVSGNIEQYKLLMFLPENESINYCSKLNNAPGSGLMMKHMDKKAKKREKFGLLIKVARATEKCTKSVTIYIKSLPNPTSSSECHKYIKDLAELNNSAITMQSVLDSCSKIKYVCKQQPIKTVFDILNRPQYKNLSIDLTPLYQQRSAIPTYLYSTSRESNSSKSSADEQSNIEWLIHDDAHQGMVQDVESTTTSRAESYDDIPVNEETIIAPESMTVSTVINLNTYGDGKITDISPDMHCKRSDENNVYSDDQLSESFIDKNCLPESMTSITQKNTHGVQNETHETEVDEPLAAKKHKKIHNQYCSFAMCEIFPNLTIGSRYDYMKGRKGYSAILQVLEIRLIKTKEPDSEPTEKRYRLILYDGKHFMSSCVLGINMSGLVKNDILKNNSIARVNSMDVCNAVTHGERVIFIIRDITVVLSDCEKIGNPIKLTIIIECCRIFVDDENIDQSPTTPLNVERSQSLSKINKTNLASDTSTHECKFDETNGFRILLTGSTLNTNAICNIRDLHPFRTGWIIKTCVVNKSNLREYSKVNRNGKVFNLGLVDKSDGIQVAAFDRIAEQFYKKLEIKKNYFLSNASITPANQIFNPFTNIYQMILRFDTQVRLC
ncbi:unnamed protein product [Rotaria socialis]